MNINDLCKYHNKTIDKIKKGLKKIIQLIDAFIEIEKTYVMTLITSDSELKPNQFDIIIEDEDD